MVALRLPLAVFAAYAVSRAGSEYGRRYRARQRELREIRSALRALETEVVYGRTPLELACQRLTRRELGAGALLFAETGLRLAASGSARAAWLGALDAVSGRLALDDEDRRVLASLGSLLGQSDAADQAAHLGMVREMLAEREQGAAEEARRNGRLWGYLGALAGLGLVLLVY
jgi:stage III sporulation protein AB